MTLVLLLTLPILAVEPVLLDRPPPKLATGTIFRDELQRDISAVWGDIELRSVLMRLQQDRGVAVLLDRRIDPNARYEVRFTGEQLRDAFVRLGQLASADASFPENVVYVGPADSARWLLTAIEQGETALASPELKIPERRQFDLASRKVIHWQNLSEPRDVLQQIAGQYQLSVEGLDAVPYDLWATATLPLVSAAEALTLVTIQLDLRWDWLPGGRSIQLRTWETPPLIERRYQPRGKTAAEAVKQWADELSDAQVRVERGEIVVVGRTEDHRLAQILRTTGSIPRREVTATNTVPLRRRLFTLKVERVPARAILQELEKSGATFVYDASGLKEAGVSLEHPITLDVSKVDADAFFKTLFDPLKLAFEINDRTVTLSPKR
jgi:hypothetical protein